MLNPRSSECRTQGLNNGVTESPRQSVIQPVQSNPASQTRKPSTSQSQPATAIPAKALHATPLPATVLPATASEIQPHSPTEPSPASLIHTSPTVDSEELVAGRSPQVSSSDYEEQSFRSVATIRLSQPLLLPPYKRDQLPDAASGDSADPPADPIADDDLTYERLGQQFRDLTAKVSLNPKFYS